ncbi:threonine aldolase [Psychromicrobium lacuslunae]|uniref:Threonine aldolase n=1 Tax=Psychromicrobium lacuslunae TaxID=1618207 RepID=A0A0D4C421_9MICC|nr:threonine aldolase [Psychromicrobium lacuslunae]
METAKTHSFASDNYSGAHPEVLEALVAANVRQQIAYGEDAYTTRLQERLSAEFGVAAEVYPVFNGTGANVVGLQTLVPRWGSVICAQTAHVNVDEGGAPEKMAGLKLLAIPTEDGKLTPELIDTEAYGWGDEHRAQPSAVTITQSSEVGTLYTAAEVRAIAEHVHSLGMSLHMDGSRVANAAAALNVPLREFTSDAGVDVLSFGGTKNGLVLGEAVVVLNPEASKGSKFIRKTSMQLASKMRFVSAQFLALLEDELWLRSAAHANAMASRMRTALDAAIANGQAEGLRFMHPTQVNSLFAQLPKAVTEQLRTKHRFYDWDEAAGVVRWVCSFDTQESDVDLFVEDLIAAFK